jgi:hypothetical protein
MKGRPLLILALSASATVAACASDAPREQAAIKTCKDSLATEFEVQIHESIAEDDKDYKEHAGLKFGRINQKQAYIQYDGSEPVLLEDIPFNDLDHRSLRLKSSDVAIDQSDLYVRIGRHHRTYCLQAPFGGLGLSGRFQGFAALIALEVEDGVASNPVGEVIRRR